MTHGRALIVDDVAQNRYLLEALLRGNGYDVTSAGNGCEALDLARRAPPDLVISDILMPVMDGFALCRVWKQDPQLKSIPFVFYTATYTDPKDERLALGLGADRFIIKPIEPDAFVKAIDEVLLAHSRAELGSRASDVDGESYLREHNRALVRKLERKLAQLEESNRSLSNEICERRRVEQALRDSEERFRRVVQQSPLAIAVLGEHGAIQHLNEQFTVVFGYTRQDVPDLDAWWTRTFPDDQTRREVVRSWQKEVSVALREGRDVEPREVIVTSKDGKVRTVEVHVASVGKSVLVIFNDITERRRLEVLRDRFLASAAHELKTPVTTIKGYAQLLLRWAGSGDRPMRERVALATVDAQCDRIQRRVDEMLAAARYQTGLAPMRVERIDFGELTRDIVLRLQATTDTHRVLLEESGPVPVKADRERLDEAMATLVERMLRALPDGEDVKLRLWGNDGEARLTISGHGTVIPPDQQEAYFEPMFERRPPADARRLPAVELGPYLAKLAIEQQKGRVWFERSDHDDAVFVVALPIAEA
jgi:PAS domain S-box-containing protein